jgi:hypothetical protein
MPESGEKNKLKEIAASANTAAREENWYLLTSVVLDLNISLSELPEVYVDKISSSCTSMEDKISSLKSCYAILWKNSDEEKRNEVLDNFIRMKFKV